LLKKVNVLYFFILILLISIFIGCDSAEVVTIEWIEEDGWLHFYTNDSNFNINDKNNYGYSEYLYEQIDNPMTSRAGLIKKISGNPYTGYGIYFCYNDEDNFYILWINTKGEYMIGQCVQGNRVIIDLGGESENLKKGFGVENKLEVKKKEGEYTFEIYFNDEKEKDLFNSSFIGGKFGFFVYVGDSSQESFPAVPEEVFAKEVTP